MNDTEIDDLIKLAKELRDEHPYIGFQNFLVYKGGRKPAKARSMSEFFNILKSYEDKHKIRLKLCGEDYRIYPDKVLEKPFNKGDVIKAEVKCPGRKRNEVIACANDRSITVRRSHITKGSIKVKIIRDKHNIFTGVLA